MNFRILVLLTAITLVSCQSNNKLEDRVEELTKKVETLENSSKSKFRPGMGTLMNAIQIHHLKLWKSGISENWELANFELEELGERFEDLEKYHSGSSNISRVDMIYPQIGNLEKVVKEMELRTIKSHINPHFIFNSLNSIRALVDENPDRARKAITELSNILRSSLQVEKVETVTLKNELDIVKDYLAIEQMRFEERLKIELEIDDKMLIHLVPPMMLQTLVENAIKHGISKRVNGGLVKIIAKEKGHQFEIIVQNTGNLIGNYKDGFGFKSTRDRLKILYGDNAYFSVQEITRDMVEAKVVLPIL